MSSAPVGDVGAFSIARQDHIVGGDADLDLADSLARFQIDDGERIVARLAHVGALAIAREGDSGRVRGSTATGASKRDFPGPGDGAICGDGCLVESRLCVCGPQSSAFCVDGDAMHRSTAARETQLLAHRLHLPVEHHDAAVILDEDPLTCRMRNHVDGSTGEIECFSCGAYQLTGRNPVSLCGFTNEGRFRCAATG